jgi:hypothetical protein
VRWRAPEAGSEGFGRIDGDLAVSGLDARRLDKRAVSTAIAGRLAASADAAGQRFSVDLRDPRLALRLKGRHADGELVLDEAFAAARQARLEARGKLALAGDGRFEASGSLSRFDPRAFVASAPPADLNARFSAAGRRAPELAATLKLELAPSSLEGKPLAAAPRWRSTAAGSPTPTWRWIWPATGSSPKAATAAPATGWSSISTRPSWRPSATGWAGGCGSTACSAAARPSPTASSSWPARSCASAACCSTRSRAAGGWPRGARAR